jgi:carbamoyltransferase
MNAGLLLRRPGRKMSALILAVHPGVHDAGAAVFEGYELKAAVQLERLTRRKSDGSVHPDASIDEVLAIIGATRRDVDVIAFSRSELPVEYFHYRGLRYWRERFRTIVRHKHRRFVTNMLVHAQTPNVEDIFDVPRYQRDCGFRDDAAFYFYNHHEAHALPALFYTDWDDALLVTADGGGDTVYYSHRHFRDGRIETMYGGDEYLTRWSTTDSIGQAFAGATQALGFIPNRHEGKLTGLSALGEPVFADDIAARFSVDEAGRVHSTFCKNRDMFEYMAELARDARREDIAASIQKVLEDVMLLSIRRLLARHPARHLGVAGGIFANVKLNRLLVDSLPLEEIFVVPPMGDEGLPMGGALCYLLNRDGLEHWLKQRRRLSDMYYGRDYTGSIDPALRATPGVRPVAGSPVALAVERLAHGQIGAIYTGRMEYGPRALGARSILANPAERETHDLLNRRLDRTEFMPFAPIVRAERAAELFDVTDVNAYACRFMTITCDVRPAWRERIKAVVHVDGSARPQVIERAVNPLYYDIVAGFEEATGIPALVNTSFNVHEEPIVNAPSECAQALTDGRIDFVVTNEALYECAPG